MAQMPDHLPDFGRVINAGGLQFKIDPTDAELGILMAPEPPTRQEVVDALADTQQAFVAAKMLYAQLLCHQRHTEYEIANWDAMRVAEVTQDAGGKKNMPQWRAQQMVKSSGHWLDRKKSYATVFGAVYAVDGHVQALQWKMQTLQALLASGQPDALIEAAAVVPKGMRTPYGEEIPEVPTSK